MPGTVNKIDTISGYAGVSSLRFHKHHRIRKRNVKDDFVGEVMEERKMGYKSLKWAYCAGRRGGAPWLWEGK